MISSLWRTGSEGEKSDWCIVSTFDTSPETWRGIAGEIRDLLVERGWGEARVEIRNTSKMYTDFSTCLPTDAQLLDYITRVTPEIEELVDREMEYTSLAFHQMVSKWDDTIPRSTLIVFVEPGQRAECGRVTRLLVGVLDEAAVPDITVNVEILPGVVRLGLAESGSEPRPALYTRLTSTMPINGCSIGIRGSRIVGVSEDGSSSLRQMDQFSVVR